MKEIKRKNLAELEKENQEKQKVIDQLKAEAETANFNALTALDVSATLYEMLIEVQGGMY